jgi:hypothetical protein
VSTSNRRIAGTAIPACVLVVPALLAPDNYVRETAAATAEPWQAVS